MTEEQTARLLAAAQAAIDGLELRNQVIYELYREGVALRDIARTLGMTHPGIRKIIQKQNEAPS